MLRSALLTLAAGAAAFRSAPAAHAAPLGGAHDEDHRPATPIDFATAVDRAAVAPEVTGVGSAARGWRGAIDAAPRAGLVPRLQLSPGRDDAGWAWQAELVVGLGTRRAREARRVAEAELAEADADRLVRRRDRLREAARAWIASRVARAELALADEELARAVELEALAARARAAGAGTRVEESAARAYRAELEARHLEVEGRVADADLALTAAVNAAEVVTAEGPLPAPRVDGPVDAPEARARQSAAFAARRRAEAAAALGGRLVEVGVRGEGDAATRAGYVVFGVTLGSADRGHLERAAQRARAVTLDGEAAALARRAALAQEQARHDVEHTRRLVETVERRAAALEEHVAAIDAARLAGEVLLVELVQARRALVAARAGVEEARGAAALALVERALAAGWGAP